MYRKIDYVSGDVVDDDGMGYPISLPFPSGIINSSTDIQTHTFTYKHT